MSPVDDPLPASLAHRMIGDDRPNMSHDDPPGEHHDLDGLAHQAPRRVGAFLPLRRMSLTGNAMAHAILPGPQWVSSSLPAKTMGPH